MAVVPEPPWVNKTSGVSARNGTTTHTISLGFTPTSGNFLVFVAYGSITHTNAAWTERVQPVSNGELSVFTKTSDGTETSFVDTNNNADRPVAWAAYEFAAGTTWTGAATTSDGTGAFAQLTGLPGSEQVVLAAMGVASNNTNGSSTSTAAWTGSWVEDAEVSAAFATTDGGSLMVGHQINVTATSITPTATLSHTGSPVSGDFQTATWALNAAAPGPTVSAGADVTHTVSTQFSRTATESGMTGVTARNWEIVSGPGGAVSSIGTAAALTWTPTVTGSYVLRYSATHSTGTATDDVTVTVAYPRISTDITDVGTSAMVSTAAGATSVVPAYPANVATGDAVYAYLHVRGGARTVTTPANWALVGSVVSGTTSAEGAGVGPTRTHVYKRIADSALTGTQSFTISAQATSGVAQGYMRAFRASGTALAFDDLLLGWSIPTTGTGAGSATPNGAVTVTAGQLAAKDVVQVSIGASDDALTSVSVGSLTCTGATFGATSAAPSFVVTANGNDMTTAGAVAAVTAGSNSGTTLNVPVTFNAAEQMHGLAHRIRATVDDVPVDVDVTAVVASGSGTAGSAQAAVAAPADAPPAAGAAGGPTVSIRPAAAAATGTGAAGDAAVSVSVSAVAQVASGSGAAGDAVVSTAALTNVTPTTATGTGAAGPPQVSVQVGAGVAAAAGVAGDASVSTATGVDVTAQPATATGAAGTAVASVAVSATIAAGGGAANAATSAVRVNPAGAAGAGAAGNAAAATAQVTVTAGRARPVAIGGSVLLDVTATPPGGQTISGYSWSIISGGGSLTNAATATPTYTAPASGSALAVIRATVTSTGGGVGTADNTVSYHANVVAAENALTGTARATWDLPTSALGGIATLQGFADGVSYNRDQTVNFKIAQSDGAGWTANVYRLGYYAGTGARDYGPATPSGGQVTTSQSQPAPTDADTTTTKLSAHCGGWSTTLTWTPPAWAPSGIYVLRLSRTGGGASHVRFVLRDDARAADVMVMPSDLTEQAYNAFGGMGSGSWLAGNSLYFGTAIDQYNADCAKFFSVDRPVINRTAASGELYGDVEWPNFFTCEYPMIRFLERNGIDCKYYANLDAAADPDGDHLIGDGTHGPVGTAMMIGHSEYWSDSMRAGWEAAKAAGVNIFSCAGNEVFWRMVGVSGSNDAAGRPRRFECYKSTLAAGRGGGRPEWTGTWRDPNGTDAPENTLTGTIFVVNGATLNTLQVPFAGGYSAQPLWRHTTVAALTTGQTYTSPSQILGFEWDTYGPAGVSTGASTHLAAPHARARYCSTATHSIGAGFLLTDAGGSYGSGTATHRLVVHPNGPNGGITFGTGSMNWALGVDNANTYQLGNDNTDVAIQQATINMLADMGAAAATLMAGLTAPTPLLWFADIPATGATGAGSAGAASAGVGKTPTTATGAGSAGSPALSISVSVAAQTATGSGAAGAASARVAPAAAAASAAGAALDAAVSTASATNATAQQAVATGTVGQPAIALAATTTPAAGAGTAGDAAVASAPGAQQATAAGAAGVPQSALRATTTAAPAAGTAPNATAATTGATSAPATVASGTGAAGDAAASTSLGRAAGAATGTGTAQNASATAVSANSALAQAATGSGAAGSPGLSTSPRVPAQSATGSGTAGQAAGLVLKTVIPQTAAATGTAEPPLVAVSATALTAMAVGQASAAFAQLPVVRGSMRPLHRTGPQMRGVP